jgi:hypothetical protein
MARVLDLGGAFNAYNTSKTPEEADAIAIYNDFKTIGDDLRQAVKQYAEEENLPQVAG